VVKAEGELAGRRTGQDDYQATTCAPVPAAAAIRAPQAGRQWIAETTGDGSQLDVCASSAKMRRLSTWYGSRCRYLTCSIGMFKACGRARRPTSTANGLIKSHISHNT
jgi:hypothetical protein